VKAPVSRIFPGILLVMCLSGALYPQSFPAGETAGPSYLIPQTVFVGDRGRLVVPLKAEFLQIPPLVIQNPGFLSGPENLTIHRIELDHRGGAPRLLVDFIAYAPGDFILPPIEIPVSQNPEGAAPIRFTGLRLRVASILNGETLVLSPPAPSLAVPGTALVIYGTAAGLILLVLGITWYRRWGGDRLRRWGRGWRRRRLIALMENMLKRLRRDLVRAGPGLPGTGELLGRVSGEFRDFLSLFTGINCRAMTAGEFSDFSLRESSGEDLRLSGTVLREFFHRWDRLRFSGREIPAEELLGVLGEVLAFLSQLKEDERQNRRTAAGSTGSTGTAGLGPEKTRGSLSPGGAG
jgi:hypothetical protein